MDCPKDCLHNIYRLFLGLWTTFSVTLWLPCRRTKQTKKTCRPSQTHAMRWKGGHAHNQTLDNFITWIKLKTVKCLWPTDGPPFVLNYRSFLAFLIIYWLLVAAYFSCSCSCGCTNQLLFFWNKNQLLSTVATTKNSRSRSPKSCCE